MADRHRFRVYIDFISDRDGDQLEKFLIASLQKAGVSINYLRMIEKSSIGRPSVLRPKIEALIQESGPEWEGIPEEIAEALDIKLSSVKRILKQMSEEDKLERVYESGQGILYRAIPQ